MRNSLCHQLLHNNGLRTGEPYCDVVGVSRLLCFLILDMVCVRVNSVPEPAVLLFFIHRGGHRACGCIVLNVVPVRYSDFFVLSSACLMFRLPSSQEITRLSKHSRSLVLPPSFVSPAVGRGDNRRIGPGTAAERTEGIVVLCHCNRRCISPLSFLENRSSMKQTA